MDWAGKQSPHPTTAVKHNTAKCITMQRWFKCIGSCNWNSFGSLGTEFLPCSLCSVCILPQLLLNPKCSCLRRFRFCYFSFKVHNEFILPSEKEGFIHRMGDIIKRAESLMAKGQPVHSSGHRLAQPAFHSGANSLSSSQVGHATPQCRELRIKEVTVERAAVFKRAVWAS